MNEKGLVTTGTSSHPTNKHTKLPLLGLYFLMPLLLQNCASVKEGCELISSIGEFSGAGNILISDTNGNGVVIEIAPGRHVIREAQDGIIYSTNCFLFCF